MTLKDLIASFRVDADDKAQSLNGSTSDLLWPDDDVTRWFNEAVEEAALRKRLIFDETTPEVCEIAVEEGVSGYPLNSALVEITAAFLHTAGSERVIRLTATDRDEMDRIRPDWRTERCTPKYFIQEDTRIYLPGIVDADYTMKLEGYRLPLDDEQMSDESDVPVIAQAHHRFLVHWPLHRAYGKQDADTFDPNRAALALDAFEKYFGLRPDADLRKDQQANRPHHNKAYW